MSVPKSVITDAELEVLKALWDSEPLAARDVAEKLYGDASRASMGTVQKLIARLEEKGMVHRDRSGPVHQFTASVSRRDIAGMQIDEFARKLSDGSLSPFVMHLVCASRLSRKERAQIRKMLEE